MSADTENHDAILTDALKLAENGNLAAATDALRSALEIDFRGEVAGLVTEFEEVLRSGVGAALATETLRLLVEQSLSVPVHLEPRDVQPSHTPQPRTSPAFQTAPRKSASNPITSTLAKLRDRLSGAARVPQHEGRQEALTLPAMEAVPSDPGATIEQEARWINQESFDLSESSPGIEVLRESEAREASASRSALSTSDAAQTLDAHAFDDPDSEDTAAVVLSQPTPFGFADADFDSELGRERRRGRGASATMPRNYMPEELRREQREAPQARSEGNNERSLASSKETGRMRPVGELESAAALPIPALLEQARALASRGDLASAVELLDEILSSDPQHLEAQELRADVGKRIGMLRLSALEPLDRVPRLDVGKVTTVRLTPQSMFIVSLADGSLTLRDMIDMSGMSVLAAAEIIGDLINADVLRLN